MIEGSKEYQQTVKLIAEDVPEIIFYTKEDVKTKAMWCRDKYYHQSVYRYNGSWEYLEMYLFILNTFKYRGL